MKKRIDALLKETMEPMAPPLLVSVNEIRVTLPKGEPGQDSFRVGTASGKKIKGQAYTDNRRIVLGNETFSGAACVIYYGIDVYGLNDGDVIEGTIHLLTDIGEASIPVHAEITETIPEPFDQIRSLDNFAKLAAKDFREAFRLFTNENFASLLRGKNRKLLSLYRGLSHNPVTYQHLEEFLIAAGKKEPVHLSFDKAKKVSYVLNRSMKDTLYIYKNTWGYVHVEIAVQGDFLSVSKKMITSDDFIGKVYGLEFIIDWEKLKGRRCSGKIILKTVYETLELELAVDPFEGMQPLSDHFRRQRILKLCRDYLKLQMKKMDYRTWYDSSQQCLEELKEENENIFTLFAEGYLAACQEEKARLAELLWPVKSGEITLEKPWHKAVYLYLAKEAGILPAEQRRIAPKLHALYRQAPQDYIILELYLRETETQGYPDPWGLSELEKVYDLGCRSPFLYLRAWRILSRQESLLRRLSPFLIRVLLFAQQEGFLSESLLLRAAFLSAHLKTFSGMLYHLLERGYQTCKRREILEAVCKHLMNGNPSNPAYFPWYEKAVAQDIRLTRLYEYYMETRPETMQTPLPMAVKLYFSYNTATLGDRKRAYLYACILKEKETDPVSWENYEKLARDFAAQSLRKGRINESYAALYREFYAKIKDAETAGYIADILFVQKLVCSDPKIHRVVVCHPALKELQSCTLTDGAAWPHIYSSDACILFEDGKKRRYAATVEYTMQPLLDVESLAHQCMLFGIWGTGMQLYCCHERTWQVEINRKNLISFWKAAENPYFTREYRDKTRKKVLEYMCRRAEDWKLLPFVESMKEATYGRLDKAAAFDVLLRYGQYTKAFQMVSQIGCEGIEDIALLKLAMYVIKARTWEKDAELLALTSYIYRRGIYTEEILSYLSRYGVFDVQETQQLWEAMDSFGMDTYEIAEKYLGSSMLSGRTTEKSEEILGDYTRKAGKQALCRAYLNFLAMLYIWKGRQIGKSTAQRMKTLCEQETGIFCALAWLKYEAGLSEIPEEDHALIRGLLQEFGRRHCRMDFFRAFPAEITAGMQLEGKVFAQEYQNSSSQVVLHYCVKGGEDAAEHWREEPMHMSLPGVYTREFLLFYGEQILYYCTVTDEQGTKETQKRCLKAADEAREGRTKYQLLNTMCRLRSLGAEKELEKTMETYLRQEACVRELFSII